MFQNYLKAWHFVWLRCGRSEFVYSTISTFLPKMHWNAFATNGVKQMAWKIPESAKQNRGEQTSSRVPQQHLVPMPPLTVCVSLDPVYSSAPWRMSSLCKRCGIPSRCLAHKKMYHRQFLLHQSTQGCTAEEEDGARSVNTGSCFKWVTSTAAWIALQVGGGS